MNADFSHKEETDAIIGSAFAVLNEIGLGYHEKPYENGLAVELKHRGISFLQQPRYPNPRPSAFICGSFSSIFSPSNQ